LHGRRAPEPFRRLGPGCKPLLESPEGKSGAWGSASANCESGSCSSSSFVLILEETRTESSTRTKDEDEDESSVAAERMEPPRIPACCRKSPAAWFPPTETRPNL
jgi:hypothetical protein